VQKTSRSNAWRRDSAVDSGSGEEVQGPLFRKDNADLNSMMTCFIQIRLVNLDFTKYTCAIELSFARFWQRVSMAVRCHFSLTFQLGIEYYLGISSVT